jgi:hypothetical protein
MDTKQYTALIFPGLVMSPETKFLKHIAHHLKQYQIDARILPNHTIQDNTADFRKLEVDENLMPRLISTVNDTLAEVENDASENILLIGASCGTRFMTAYALANQLGLFQDSDQVKIHGMLGFSIYTNLRLSKPTPEKIGSPEEINHMDFSTNTGRLKDTLLYDVYAHLDSLSSETAKAREERYKQQGLNFKQHRVECCDYPNNRFYEREGEKYHLYTENSAHNFKNGYVLKDDETFECVHRIHGPGNSPVEAIIDQFLIDTGVTRTQ